MENRFLSNSEEETFQIGYEFAKSLKGGDIIALNGDLGAGKTVFTKGICEYFHVKNVTSPTYTLVNEYHGDFVIYHFDIYRLSDEEELYHIGFLDYLKEDSIVLVEWAQLLPEVFHDLKVIHVEIKKEEDYLSDKRRIEITC